MSWVADDNMGLLTDLYELTMAGSYHGRGMNDPATFDLFVRKLPKRRNFLVACGLEQTLSYLEALHFDSDAVAYLDSLRLFSSDFLSYLGSFRFSGEAWAFPEGEVAFECEPLMRITAPLIEAQLVETFVINCITYQTMVASKAARVALACDGLSFVDFSPRRDHGADAALKAARAAYVGGASGTSNVLAGRMYGLEVSGTMAHSYVMAFEDELEAFRAYLRDYPDKAVLLIDTFDVEQGARRAVQAANEVRADGVKLLGVRIDSGDLAHLARSVRKILDEGGLGDTQILLSGDLDEYRIAELVADEVPADSFGVGTQLGTSGDEPSLGGVYKLVADRSGPKIKLSTDKATLPGVKQVYRLERDGLIDHDVIALADEDPPEGGRALLVCAMSDGARTSPPEPLDSARDRCRHALERMPPGLKSLTEETDYEVVSSPALAALVREMRRRSR